MKLVTTALEWSYEARETEVRAERLKSAAELLVLRHDTLKFIDGADPDVRPLDQNKAEPAGVHGKAPEKQTIPENERAKTSQTAGTAEEPAPMSTSPNCTFSGEVVSIDPTQFTDSGITLVECPHCGRMRSLSPSKGVLRFKAHTQRKQQTLLTEKRWSATGTTDWDVVGG